MVRPTVVYPRIDAALETVSEELAIAVTEAEAFRTFRSRIHRLSPVETSTSAAGGGLVSAATVVGVDPDDVRDAYRDTVMAVDHYEREYGEPLLKNVGKEFGPSVRQIVDGRAPILDAQVRAIDAAAEQAVEDRRRFATTLETERESLETVHRGLGEIERQYHECTQARERANRAQVGSNTGEAGAGAPSHSESLLELVDDCQTLAEDRQEAIHRGPPRRISGIGDCSLGSFLYGDADTHFPALTEITALVEQIESAIYE